MPLRKILSSKEAIEKSLDLKKDKKTVVLAGGCFDILHAGHIAFLKEAKKRGDRLFVMLESDESIRLKKGTGRPVHTQKARASILSTIDTVDYVILLPLMKGNQDYDELIFALKPDIIATTKGDGAKTHKERQSRKIGAELVEVIKRIENISTTKLKNVLNNKK